ncbi:hypothetical protein BJX96DRAFT_177017 [Aspergillus floccosus]
MNVLELSYPATLAGIATILLLVSFLRCLTTWSRLLSPVRHGYLRYLVYPRLNRRIPGIALLSPLQIILTVVYFVGTGLYNLLAVHTLQQASRRAAHLSLINLSPSFLSCGREFGARLLGLSLETYGIIHRTTGFMSVVQAAIHITIQSRTQKFTTADQTQYYGLVAACMLLSLVLFPLIKRRVYEVFLVAHIAGAFIAFYMVWMHIQPATKLYRVCFFICLCTFTGTGALQLLRILFRNVVLGRNSVRMGIKPCSGDIVQVRLRLPRPWTVQAGERVNLGVPRLGIFYFFQVHPFAISWWEENDSGRVDTIYLIFRARTGFTRKVLNCLEPDREYWAWIDGPFGPSAVHNCSSSRDLGDYGHILMVASGIGIAAQLPYIKELLRKRREASVRTQTVTLIWKLDRTGDWECARDWLQELVTEDNGYKMLKVSVYDPLRLRKDTQNVGEHELITIHGGEVDWAQVFFKKMLEVLVYEPLRLRKDTQNTIEHEMIAMHGDDWAQVLFQKMLEASVHDPKRLRKDTSEVIEHELVTIHGGEVDWAQVLSQERRRRAGKILVSVSAERRIRTTIQQLVRSNVQLGVDLFELEFQPWQERRDWWSFLTP